MMASPRRTAAYTTSVVLFIVLVSLDLEARAQTPGASRVGNAPLEVPAGEPVVPASVEELLYAREFVLERGYRVGWPPDAPPVRSGTIVVVRSDPSLTVPRQAPTPILYAGNHAVEVLNTGQDSGVLIGIVPETALEELADQPVWFGPPRINGMIDEKTIEEDRRAALSAGIPVNTADDLRRVSRDAVRAPDLATLLRDEIADLVLEFVPDERDLAAKWRLPEVGEVKGSLQRP